jgi:hypothetical protein
MRIINAAQVPLMPGRWRDAVRWPFTSKEAATSWVWCHAALNGFATVAIVSRGEGRWHVLSYVPDETAMRERMRTSGLEAYDDGGDDKGFAA